MSGDTQTPRFPPVHRRVLLLQPGVGELVVRRLEEAGISSLESLLAQGVPQAVEAIGNLRNRSRALERAVAALQARSGPASRPVNGHPPASTRSPLD